jgi:predicted ferric reductase
LVSCTFRRAVCPFVHRLRITACNIALVVFLALKNTPLAFLTSYSYERLRILHQTAGCCIIVSVILHAVTYLITLSQGGILHIMREQNQIMGIVAGSTVLVILATALTFRRVSYEMFYVTHITLFMLLMIALSLHRPFLTGKAIYIFIFTASIWALDRTYRVLKLIRHALSNTASVTPLENGGVRIMLSRTPSRAVSGSHIFLWIPKIRVAETHPFTIVSTNPLELVVSAQDGFTKDLLVFASQNPGQKLRASCDGPYGNVPKFSAFNHVILIAGGSGASYTFGIALDIVRKAESSTIKPIIHFIWVIQEHSELPSDIKWIKFPNYVYRTAIVVYQRARGIKCMSPGTAYSACHAIPSFYGPPAHY